MSKRRVFVCIVASVFLPSAARSVPAQVPSAVAADVRTVGDIVRVSYEVISGPAGTPRQWRRDSTLYIPAAMFVATGERAGKVYASEMTPEQYRRRNDSVFVARGFVETEIGRRIERFGNVAQVRSVAVARESADGPVIGRSVNYFQLYWDGTRWWITGIVWDDERPGAPIPPDWIGRWEDVVR